MFFIQSCVLVIVAAVRLEENTYTVKENVTSFTIGVILSGDIAIPIDAKLVFVYSTYTYETRIMSCPLGNLKSQSPVAVCETPSCTICQACSSELQTYAGTYTSKELSLLIIFIRL